MFVGKALPTFERLPPIDDVSLTICKCNAVRVTDEISDFEIPLIKMWQIRRWSKKLRIAFQLPFFWKLRQ